MIKLNYKSINLPHLSPIVAISDIDSAEGDTLCISIPNEEFSFVIIDDKRYKLHSGKREIALDLIPDGICEVSFVLGAKRIPAAPFFKKDRTVARVPSDSFTLEALEKILLSVFVKLLTAEDRILALEEKIIPQNMFKFSQTK